MAGGDVLRSQEADGRARRHSIARRLRPVAVLVALATAALAAAPGASGTTLTSAYGPVYENLSYGPRLVEKMVVFESAAPGSPIVVLVHGGGWHQQFALSRFAPEARALQSQGFTVVDINYQQDSERRPAFSIENDDVSLATRWAVANATQYHGDPNNVYLLGASAGGQLVGVAAEQLNAARPGTVKGVISLSGPMNLASMIEMVEEGRYTNEEFAYSLQMALGRLPGTTVFPTTSEQQTYPANWSPALQVSAGACPRWLLFNSSEEGIPLSQAQEMQGAAEGAGCSSTLQVVPGSKHAFAYWSVVAPKIYSFIRGN